MVDYKTNKKHLVRSLTPAITDFYIDVYHKHALVFCGQVEEYLGQIIDVRKLVHENYLHLLAGKKYFCIQSFIYVCIKHYNDIYST